jgi:hypothetical protein
VPHEEIASELGVSTTVVDNRLSRMRAKFRAKLAALGMLTLLLLLLGVLLISVGGAGRAPDPQTPPVESAPRVRGVSAWEGGTPAVRKNRTFPSEEIAP